MVVVTAANDGGSDSSTSAPSALLPAPPANTAPPTITGDEHVGGTLTADPGTWTGTGPLTYGYEWQRCDVDGTHCIAIPGATHDTYVPTPQDSGSVIVVVVTASNVVDQVAAPAQPTPQSSRPWSRRRLRRRRRPPRRPRRPPRPGPRPWCRARAAPPASISDAQPAPPPRATDQLMGDLGDVAGAASS